MVVEDVGTNAVGMRRNWYTIEHARELTADELAEALLRDSVEGAAGGESGRAQDAAAEGASSSGAAASGPSRIELQRFISMLESERACIWRECFFLADLKRVREKAAAAEKAALEPPFYTRWWNRVTGAGGSAAA